MNRSSSRYTGAVIAAVLLGLFAAFSPRAALAEPKRQYQHVVPPTSQPSERDSLPDDLDIKSLAPEIDSNTLASPREPEVLRVDPPPLQLQNRGQQGR
jgi:hypothetical protein